MKIAQIGIFALTLNSTEAVKVGKHHHHRSVPACSSADYGACGRGETVAPEKLQADQDKHNKDYFVPNFGVDRDIVDSHSSLR